MNEWTINFPFLQVLWGGALNALGAVVRAGGMTRDLFPLCFLGQTILSIAQVIPRPFLISFLAAVHQIFCMIIAVHTRNAS